MSPQSIRLVLVVLAATFGAATLTLRVKCAISGTEVHPAVFAILAHMAGFSLIAWLITTHAARLKDDVTGDVLAVFDDAGRLLAQGAVDGYRISQAEDGSNVTRIEDYWIRRRVHHRSG